MIFAINIYLIPLYCIFATTLTLKQQTVDEKNCKTHNHSINHMGDVIMWHLKHR